MNAITIHARLPMPPEANASGITPQQWRVLTDIIWPGAKSPAAVCMAWDYCRARKLDPLKKPVHIVPVWNSTLGREVETVWPGISEIQTTAARTGQWAGMDEPKWGVDVTRTFKGSRKQKNGGYKDIELTLTFPDSCTVTVYRMVSGERRAFSEPVFWEEAYSRSGRSELPNEMWQKRPRGQLHKVAKAAALRAAFPEEITDYTAEEMEGKEISAGGVVIEGDAIVQDATVADAEYTDLPTEADPKAIAWKDALVKLYDAARTEKGIQTLIDKNRTNYEAMRTAWPRMADEIDAAVRAARLRIGSAPAEFNFAVTDEFGEIVSEPIGSPDRFAHALLDHWRKTADKALATELLHNNADAIAALPADVRATLDEIEAPAQGMEV